ncbi:kinetochore protein Nuf2-like [Cotesia glomerata]|uniref:kinetochore protein Nuf2-like n=1 Tax=Cotesia glomerata TaxID=32391 RepID=UPI001D01BC67|nr:kinetochore protein Nuf2-like [Cotesia glomerata]
MDFSPESVYSLLTELGFPVTMEDLKNPTEPFMIKFLTDFCQRFHIDAQTLTQLAFEQVELLKVTGDQNASHVIALLNLSEVISIIGEKIFVKDFSVTDITAPGAKRTRKIIKFLANFALYAEGASIKMQEETDKIFAKAQEIENTKKKSDEMKEQMNKKAADMAAMMAQIEANNKKSEEIKARMKRRQEKIELTRKHNEDLLKTCSKLREAYSNKCNEVSKLESISLQLKAKIVDDPSKERLRLQELMKEQVEKEENKAATEEAIQQKETCYFAF